MRPSGAPDSDGAKDSERLPPPFLGNTEVCKGKGHIMAGAGTANSSPMIRRTIGERATEKAYCPTTSVKPAVTKPTTMAPNGPAPA